MATVQNLRFSHNWNHKLLCNYWTTLRLWNAKKYQVGYVYEVYLKDEFLGQAELVSMRRTKASKLNQFVCGLDTGYSVPQTQEILSRMYKNQPDPDLFFGLFRWVKRQPNSTIDLKLKVQDNDS